MLFARLGVRLQCMLTDNGSTLRSRGFTQVCHALPISHRFTRTYRPKAIGNAERFIQPAPREWAIGFAYKNSSGSTAAL